MKTSVLDARNPPAEIVELVEGDRRERGGAAFEAEPDADEAGLPARARAFAEPLVAGRLLRSGEPTLAHADAVAAILRGIGATPALCAAAYLVDASDALAHPEALIGQAFGEAQAELVANTRRLVDMQHAVRTARGGLPRHASQVERVRKMLLAFSRDLRVVLLRLASRLQTLRHHAAAKTPCPDEVAIEARDVFAPLANRLGIWQIKWELEDLAFRFLDADAYRGVARMLDERRIEREQRVEAFRARLAADLASRGIAAVVQGRPKHIYSIWKKMQRKRLAFDQVFDVRAVRVVVGERADCYAVLGRVHELYAPVPGEFDDYIERPKANGYQSLHTVVLDPEGRAFEVQIRTQAMHEHAEHGVAAHWAYKDAGAKGQAAASAIGQDAARIAEARKAVLRQLLAWEHDLVAGGASVDAAGAAGIDAAGGRAVEGGSSAAPATVEDRIYVFTPAATIVELTAGATPIDFAYAVHTDLGHRCRGAKVDGAMVPLDTPLKSGQTVEISAAKEGGPSLDWLNPALGYLRSSRAKAKVRGWFNALAERQTIARGRDAVEKLLQREGKTAIKLGDLAVRLGFRDADALFSVVGKDELSLRSIEALLRPAEPQRRPAAFPHADGSPEEAVALRKPSAPSDANKGGVLVVGIDSLMTSLARCCRPAPPDPISGYVTRGRGVAVHRTGCSNFRELAVRSPERVIAVEWGRARADAAPVYPVDVVVEAVDRQGLLRDVSETFAKEKMNLVGARTLSSKSPTGALARMTFTVEIADSARLESVLVALVRVPGVRSARRR